MKYKLVAQGNANRLYKRSDGKVIRVSKTAADPYAISNYWNDFWKPKLGEYMGKLTPIEDPQFGVVLEVDQVGGKRGSRVIAEFKPKWLIQSPEAPSNAKMCRTCAIKTMRGQKLQWCSIDLAEHDLEEFIKSEVDPKFMHLLDDGPLRSLLDQIRFWQSNLQDSLSDCMALRDCTVLVEYLENSNKCKAWVVDLDPKEGDAKLQKWNDTEINLKPFYTKNSPICRYSRQSTVS